MEQRTLFASRSCERCGRDYPVRSETQRFCAERCRKAAEKARAEARRPKRPPTPRRRTSDGPCQFPEVSPDSGYRYGCRCDRCGAGHADALVRSAQRLCRADGCQERRPKGRSWCAIHSPIATCERCDQPKATGSNFCETHKPDMAKRRRKHKPKAERGPSSAALKRLRAAVYAEESHCGICGEVVDKSLTFPHPMSPSLDHITPWRDGGAWYDRNNLRLAHFRCNAMNNKSTKAALKTLRAAARRIGSVDVQGFAF